jgi:hypothetical protein
VRGTTRDPGRLAEIEAAGAEPVVADPDRLGTLMPQLAGVSVVCWLLAPVASPDLHGPRLQTLLERLVDTPVRGFVYEGGTGAAAVREASERWRIPVRIVEQEPGDHEAWLAALRGAVAELL